LTPPDCELLAPILPPPLVEEDLDAVPPTPPVPPPPRTELDEAALFIVEFAAVPFVVAPPST
jgi:hypothetical protein